MIDENRFSTNGLNGDYILEAAKENKTIRDVMLQHNIDSKEIDEWICEFTQYASSLNGELDEYEYIRAIDYHTKNLINFIDIETYEVLYMNRACREDFQIPDDGAYKNKKCYHVFYGKNSPCDFCTFKEYEQSKWHNGKVSIQLIKSTTC